MNGTPLAAARPASRTATVASAWRLQLLFITLHIPLFVLIPKNSAPATWHALAALGFGLAAALAWTRPERVAYAAAYMAGAEVFWRMRRADVPWEFGKYAIVLILVIAMLRFVRVRRAAMPIGYFLLLLPSVALTISSLSWADARNEISFNLSGPLALTLCALFFSSVRLTPKQLQWVYACILAPAAGIAAIAAQGLGAGAGEIKFSGASNFAASGGYGPNQVSAVLALGMLAAILYLIVGAANIVVTSSMVGLFLFLLTRCALTFSRGGIWMAAGGILATGFYLLRDSRYRWRALAGAVVVLAISMAVILPHLEALTRGTIRTRYTNTDPTGRELLVAADLTTWSENLVLGAGPGMGAANRFKVFYATTAHTEYTRLVAEHGLLGLAALVLLILMAIRNLRTSASRRGKALAAAMLAYFLLHLAVDATRLAAPCFAFGLSAVAIVVQRRRVIARRVLLSAGFPQPVPGA